MAEQTIDTKDVITAPKTGADGTSAAYAKPAPEIADRTPVRGRKRRIIIPALLIALVIAAIFTLRYFTFAAHHVSTDDAQINGDITTVSAKVNGQITGIYVQDNQAVHKGQTLIRLDDRDYKAAVAQAQAALLQAQTGLQAAQTAVPLQSNLTSAQTAQAQAGIAQAYGGVNAAQARVGTAQAALAAARQRVGVAAEQRDAAQAALVKARQDLTRTRTLVSEGAVARQQYEAAVAAYNAALANRDAAAGSVNVAQSAVNQAQNDVAQAQAGVSQASAQVEAGNALLQQAQTGSGQTEIKSAQAVTSRAQVKAAEAALLAAKLRLSYTTVTAPVEGVLSKRSVNVGDVVAPGQPLMALANQGRLWVTANLKETQLRNVRVGQPVDIKVDAYPREHFKGKVQSLSAATGATFALLPPDNASGNFTKVVQRIPVRIAIDPASDRQHLLRQGLSVVVTIDTTQQR